MRTGIQATVSIDNVKSRTSGITPANQVIRDLTAQANSGKADKEENPKYQLIHELMQTDKSGWVTGWQARELRGHQRRDTRLAYQRQALR
jgi:hypothetical protein